MRRAAFILCLLAALSPSGRAAAQDSALIVNVAPQQIHMQTDFSGARVLVFGAIDPELAPVEDELQLVVTLSGPPRLYQLRRRQKLGLIWVNAPQAVRAEGPSFYALASSAPLADSAALAVRQRHLLGVDTLFMSNISHPEGRREESASRQNTNAAPRVPPQVLVENLRQRGFYTEHIGALRIIRNQLFRAALDIPPGAPSGSYQLSAYLLHRGQLISRQSLPVQLVPAGLEQRLRRLAFERPLVYGLLAVLLAALWGGLTALLPQRQRRQSS